MSTGSINITSEYINKLSLICAYSNEYATFAQKLAYLFPEIIIRLDMCPLNNILFSPDEADDEDEGIEMSVPILASELAEIINAIGHIKTCTSEATSTTLSISERMALLISNPTLQFTSNDDDVNGDVLCVNRCPCQQATLLNKYTQDTPITMFSLLTGVLSRHSLPTPSLLGYYGVGALAAGMTTLHTHVTHTLKLIQAVTTLIKAHQGESVDLQDVVKGLMDVGVDVDVDVDVGVDVDVASLLPTVATTLSKHASQLPAFISDCLRVCVAPLSVCAVLDEINMRHLFQSMITSIIDDINTHTNNILSLETQRRDIMATHVTVDVALPVDDDVGSNPDPISLAMRVMGVANKDPKLSLLSKVSETNVWSNSLLGRDVLSPEDTRSSLFSLLASSPGTFTPYMSSGDDKLPPVNTYTATWARAMGAVVADNSVVKVCYDVDGAVSNHHKLTLIALNNAMQWCHLHQNDSSIDSCTRQLITSAISHPPVVLGYPHHPTINTLLKIDSAWTYNSHTQAGDGDGDVDSSVSNIDAYVRSLLQGHSLSSPLPPPNSSLISSVCVSAEVRRAWVEGMDVVDQRTAGRLARESEWLQLLLAHNDGNGNNKSKHDKSSNGIDVSSTLTFLGALVGQKTQEIDQQIPALKDQIKHQQDELVAIKLSHEHAIAEQKRLHAIELATITAKYEEQSQKSVAIHDHELDALRRECTTLKSSNASLVTQVNTLETEMAGLIASTHTQIESQAVELTAVLESIAIMKANASESSRQAEEAKDNMWRQETQRRQEEWDVERQLLLSSIAESKSGLNEIPVLREELNDVSTSYNTLQHTLVEVEEERARMSEDLERLQAEHDNLQSTVASLQVELDSMQDECRQSTMQLVTVQDELVAVKIQHEDDVIGYQRRIDELTGRTKALLTQSQLQQQPQPQPQPPSAIAASLFSSSTSQLSLHPPGGSLMKSYENEENHVIPDEVVDFGVSADEVVNASTTTTTTIITLRHTRGPLPPTYTNLKLLTSHDKLVIPLILADVAHSWPQEVVCLNDEPIPGQMVVIAIGLDLRNTSSTPASPPPSTKPAKSTVAITFMRLAILLDDEEPLIPIANPDSEPSDRLGIHGRFVCSSDLPKRDDKLVMGLRSKAKKKQSNNGVNALNMSMSLSSSSSTPTPTNIELSFIAGAEQLQASLTESSSYLIKDGLSTPSYFPMFLVSKVNEDSSFTHIRAYWSDGTWDDIPPQ